MIVRISQQAPGVRILVGDDATLRRNIISFLGEVATKSGYTEVMLPLLEPAAIYTDKAGPEILNQMYTFKDKGDRDLCLRPEGTATIQVMARETFNQQKNVKLWYETRCWRYERPQAGRYREFTQFGMEYLWPKDPKAARQELLDLAVRMISSYPVRYEVQPAVKRGLAYYTEDGFEITCPDLGAQKQVCGGGAYAEGVGFAIGIDRLALAVQGPKEE